MTNPRLLKAVFCCSLGVFASTARADVVTDWNTAALNAIRVQRTAPPVASRALAILHVAVFDAVNGIARTHEPYLVASDVPASASTTAAASAAAYRVLVTLFPSSAAFHDLHQRTLATVADGPQKRSGIAWGESVATRTLGWRANDNADAIVPPPAGEGIGMWVPTPPMFSPYLLPQWGFVTPFAIPSSSHFRPLGPPSTTSAAYAEDFNEVKALGAASGSARTAEQTEMALFWADGAGTETPPGHWNSIAQRIAQDRGLSIVQRARLFALLNVATADAAIAAWDAKYHFNSWRPVTAIRNGDDDGNPDTAGDPAWTSLIATPPFPDYTSGHSTFSGAASAVLARFFGTDAVSFTNGSDFLPGVTRSFDSFSAAAREAADSRLFGGIHTRSANLDGLRAGIEIGEWVFAQTMQPKGNRSRE